MQQVIPRHSVERYPYRVMLPSVHLRGLGQSSPTTGAATTARYVGAAGGLAVPVVSSVLAASAASSLAAGGSGLILGMAPALAVPVIGAALALVTTLATLLIQNSGCGQTCIETSQWANQAEPLLAQNIQAYFALPSPRTISQQNAAIANFIAIWTTLVNQCSQAGTGNAGVRCISDRQSGACTWKQTTDSPLLSIPGEPQPGECWNWWNGYHDPIANDEVVADDATAAAQVAAQVAANATSTSLTSSPSSSNLYLFAGLGLLVFALMEMRS